MKRTRLQPVLYWITVFFAATTVFAQTVPPTSEPAADKTLSPYFFIKTDAPDVDRLPLKETTAVCNIAGVIADVTVVQLYENRGKRPLEAVYVFPASTRAAVYGMKMTIGERTIIAEIREREAARREYEAAKEAGKSASLLEQQRPNVFTMNVANIMPGDVIRVELKYTETIVPTGGVYEFVYPTVVGPRYSELPEAGAPDTETWVKNPYLHEGNAAPYRFDIRVHLEGGVPIKEVKCPTHKTDIDFTAPASARIALKKSETGGGDRDFVLRYRLQGRTIETGLLMYEGETENYFLLLMQPPKRVPTKEIPPREYVFILDVSGSMRGFPLDTAKKLMKNLIGRLRPRDRFNVMFFSGGSALLWETSLPATGDNLRHALRFIDARRGGGGTRILPALQRALSLPETGGFSRTFIVVTDGYVRVEREVFQMIGQSLGEANIFPFGIGSSVNRFLIEGMARAGMGEPFVVLATGDVSAAADSFRKYVQTTVLTRGEIEFEGFPAYDVEPPGIPDLFASRPVTVFGKWPKDQKPRGTIHLTGITGGDPYSAKLQVEDFSPSEKNAALKYLWARRRIATLTDEYGVSRDDRLKAEITRLGLAYHLLTSFTSFVAVDTRVRRTDEGLETVEQPLPLPQGVTDAAVGANAKARMASPAQPMMSVRAVPKKVLKENRSLESADGKAQDEESTASAEKEKAPVTITLNASKTAVSGGLTKKAVNEFAGDRLSELSGCFPAPPAEQKALTGGVPLTIVVEKSGRVRAVSIEAKWLSGTDAAECLVKKIINWRFPEAEEKTTIRLLFILVF